MIITINLSYQTKRAKLAGFVLWKHESMHLPQKLHDKVLGSSVPG